MDSLLNDRVAPSRRRFIEHLAMLGCVAALGPGPALAQPSGPPAGPPFRILMGGYGPASTGFSRALQRIGNRLIDRFGSEVEIRYVYNIMDLGYRADDILWLVEEGVLTLGYQSSSYFGDRVPNIAVADLPFLFTDTPSARAAIDGAFGQALATRIEANMGYRILGYFENGFRQISNRVRPIRSPEDLRGIKIRVLPSDVHARTFELLGADPMIMDLSEALEAVVAGTVDAQENPFANTVTYGVHEHHRFHSITNHFYLSRPIFVHRPTFDAWPAELQLELRAAVVDAVQFQRALHIEEEAQAANAIRAAGGEILELTVDQQRQFVDAVKPIYTQAHAQYDAELLSLVGL